MSEQITFCNNIVPQSIALLEDNRYDEYAYEEISQSIISLVSPKGGTGKSTLCREIALMLSMMEHNSRKLNICIVDFSFNNADMDILLNVRNDRNMQEWIDDIKTRMLNRALWFNDIVYTKEQMDKYLTEYIDGIKVLLSPAIHSKSSDNDMDIYRIMLHNLCKYGFDVIIFDISDCYSEIAIELARISEVLLVVGNEELPTLRRIRKMYEEYMYQGVNPENLKLLINNTYSTEHIQCYSDEQICSFIGTDRIYSRIEYEKNMPNHNIKKTSAVVDGSSKYIKSIKELVNNIYPQLEYVKEYRKKIRREIQR